jgi:uncharacterized membrane protein YcfT
MTKQPFLLPIVSVRIVKRFFVVPPHNDKRVASAINPIGQHSFAVLCEHRLGVELHA